MGEVVENISEHDFENRELPTAQEISEDYERELFAEFGWDPKAFREKINEYYYQEFLYQESLELKGEKEKFNRSDLYHYSFETGLIEGPNCMAFALKQTLNPLTGKLFTTRPFVGEYSAGEEAFGELNELLATGTTDEIKTFMSEKLRDDGKACGLEIKEVDKDYTIGDNEWIIAMVATDHNITPLGISDFHFYRKGNEGVWYHKPGMESVTDRDASGEFIFDPKKCDRGIYDLFLGYYAVKDVNGGITRV